MTTCANYDIPTFAAYGKDADGYGSMWTRSCPMGARFTGPLGHLPKRLQEIMRARVATITTVIYSYGTPIAWFDAGQWILPDVSYSVTTGKHQGYCWRLRPAQIPWDCSLDEYMRVLNGQMRFIGRGKDMRTAPAA